MIEMQCHPQGMVLLSSDVLTRLPQESVVVLRSTCVGEAGVSLTLPPPPLPYHEDQDGQRDCDGRVIPPLRQDRHESVPAVVCTGVEENHTEDGLAGRISKDEGRPLHGPTDRTHGNESTGQEDHRDCGNGDH